MNAADVDYAKKHLAASRDAFAKAAEDADFVASLGTIAAAMAESQLTTARSTKPKSSAPTRAAISR
jgi:hypothetical protein